MRTSERVRPTSDAPPPARSGAREEPSVVGTQSIYRALSILRSVSCSKDGVTGPEVAARFGYSIPTAYRLLRALEAEKFLIFNRRTHRYGLGPEIPRLSGAILHRDGVVPLISASLERLRERTGETAAVHWMLGTEHTCVQELLTTNPVRLPPVLGVNYPLTQGASGKALLIGLDKPRLDEILAEPDLVPPRQGLETFQAELEEARRQGYAEAHGELGQRPASVAAPIVWLDQGVAAIKVMAPAARFGPAERASAAAALLQETERIRVALGS
jgi:DNA-binding IclR family transcriptional regulator